MVALAARTRTCPDCGHRWRQRHARFCGACGAMLADPLAADRAAGRTTILRRLAGSVAVAALIAGLVAFGLALPDRAGDATLALEDAPPTRPSPLSGDEVAALRAQSDPDRLRCEPRGCELWRLPLPDDAAASLVAGIVVLADDLVLLHTGGFGTGTDTDAGGDDHLDDQGGPVVVAVDPHTGQRRWEHVVPTGQTGGVVQLLRGPHGALVVAGQLVTSLDRDGEVLWQWPITDLHGSVRGVWAAVEGDQLVLLYGWNPGGYGVDQFLAALDVDDGGLLWSHAMQEVPIVEPDTIVVVDPDGLMRRLDPATGDTLWEGPRIDIGSDRAYRTGDWLVVRREEGPQRIVDPATGEVVGALEGYLVSDFVAVEDRLVGIMIREPPGDYEQIWRGTLWPIEVVVFGPDGTLAWTDSLGSDRAWTWMCCEPPMDDGVLRLWSDLERRDYDLATGELLRAGTDDGDGRPQVPWLAGRTWLPWAGVAMTWHDDLRGLDLHTDAGTVQVRGGSDLSVASFDPLVVTDRHEAVAVGYPTDDPP